MILIVEDQPVMRALLRDFLQSSFRGTEIREAVDGGRALQVARECNPRVALLDINLPDANGIELAARFRSLFPETRVIMVSNLAGSAYSERARAAGALAYVTKDKIYADLLPLMARALNGSRPLDTNGEAA